MPIGAWVTTGEAAAALGVSARRVRQMVAAGILRGRLVGDRLMITRASVERRLRNPRPAGRPPKRQPARGRGAPGA